MANVQFENVITYLYEAFPDVRPHFEQKSKELYGEGLPHVVYGSVLVEYLNSLADQIGGENHAISDKRLKEVFGLIEELSESKDFETVCLVKTSVIEGVLGEKNGLKRFAAYMGPITRKLAHDLAQSWDLNTELLS